MEDISGASEGDETTTRTTANKVLSGRQIIALETTRSILTSPVLNEPIVDKYGRTPYSHAALANIDKLIYTQPLDIMDKTKIARMGIDLGLLTVMRWKPRMVILIPYELHYTELLLTRNLVTL
jgi:hypothetical protein